jgi:hypothetical protein
MAVIHLEHFMGNDAPHRLARTARLIIERYDGTLAETVEDGIRSLTATLPA